MSIQSIPLTTISGTPSSIGEYAGQVLLLVNVASKCGLTPQYTALEALYQNYKAQGFSVLGFPCNQFAGQEPGTEAEISEFCSVNYGVSFPLFSKLDVNGENRHPLYQSLIAALPEKTKKPDGVLEAKLASKGYLSLEPTDVMWNFEKFLIGKEGQILARFAPDLSPDDPIITKAIEAALS